MSRTSISSASLLHSVSTPPPDEALPTLASGSLKSQGLSSTPVLTLASDARQLGPSLASLSRRIRASILPFGFSVLQAPLRPFSPCLGPVLLPRLRSRLRLAPSDPPSSEQIPQRLNLGLLLVYLFILFSVFREALVPN